MTERPIAVVLGGHDLLRPLALAGIPCTVAAPPGAAIRASRFVHDTIDWDHDEPMPAQEERLRSHLQAQPTPPVLFFEYDHDLLYLSRNRERFASLARFALADADLVEDLVDKLRFHRLANRLGLPVPPTVILDPDDGYRAPADALLPAVLKPATRSVEHDWRAVDDKGKAVGVASVAELDRLRPALERYGRPVLLQSAVPGPERRIESYHVYVDGEGRTVAEFTGRKIRTLPAEYGITTSLEITDEPDVIQVGRAVVESVRLTGVAKLDFKRAPDGSLHLLEVNPRFSLWHHPAALAGINVPALVYADLAGLPRPQFGRVRPGVRWFHRNDLAAARQDGVSAWRWLAFALGSRARSGLALDDPAPILRAVLRRREA